MVGGGYPPATSINSCKSGWQKPHSQRGKEKEKEKEREREKKMMGDKRENGSATASSPMELGSGDGDEGGNKSSMRTAETLLRLVPVALCTLSLVVMLKSSQTNDFGSLSYSDLGAFKYYFSSHFPAVCVIFFIMTGFCRLLLLVFLFLFSLFFLLTSMSY